jgi:hypothetical protein
MPLPENDRKEELSYAYFHTLSARAGFSCDRPGKDRQSMDVLVHSEGRIAADSIFEQAQLGLPLKERWLGETEQGARWRISSDLA